ncbi:MAG: hypothetical protein LQ350_007116 [Teloschistes chrysophthalmus]|nr:MAG: hypothetical protein LQ350_007116 [Niorma chrysophthalma]
MAIKGSAKKMLVYSILRILAKATTSTPISSEASDKTVAAAAALICSASKRDEEFVNILLQWLSSDGLVQDLSIRRAVIAALAKDFGKLKTALSESLQSFGDKIFIKHSPILQQEGTAENLLLLTGYVHRANSQHVSEMARSGPYLNAISNRLAASSSRASLLGMCVGTAVSELVDPPDRRMNFSSDEVTGSQGQRFLRLTKVHDPLGSIADLLPAQGAAVSQISHNQKRLPVKGTQSSKDTGPPATRSKIISIEEIESEAESEEDDLPTYAKPDSDASDSDEDPTVVNRDKPTAPVYVNDLISGLRDTENYDRHTLALTHASSLIRRKATFGNEVLDSTEELASILTSLQDKWNFEAFEDLRLQAMIAVLIAQPLEMGQWFSRTYFNGDYSISQRAAMLTTLGLGARELAGYGKDDNALTKINHPSKTQNTPFPSKQLPPKLHALYAPEAPLTKTSKELENEILQPMALKAADALSGPNALKTRTFSSRMDVEKKKRTKAIPNALAKVVADGFLFPLTGRFQTHIGMSNNQTPLLYPPLLPLYLRTLALLLHAGGPATLSLPLMTTELLQLLLALRPNHTTHHLPTLDALLFAFLTLLEVNGDREGMRRLAAENGKEVLEMAGWVGGVLERVRGGDGVGGGVGGGVGDGGGEKGTGEEERVRALAAGCLGRVGEVVEGEERVLMGVGMGIL